MKLRVNWKRFVTLYGLFLIALFLTGCTAAWLSAVNSMLPALEAAITAAITFVLSLEGKTVPAAVAAAIKKIGDEISAQIANLQALIAAEQQSASTGTLSQIQAVLNAILANLSNILSNLSISDSATVTKVTQLVGLAVAAVQAILALVPLAIQKMQSGATVEELKESDHLASISVKNTLNGLKEGYVAIRAQKTTNPDVNAALDSLPASI